MPIARKIPKPAGRFWLCSVIRTKYDNTINRHYPAWFPHGYYLTFSSLCHCTIYVIARRSPFSVIILFLSLPDIFPFLSLPDLIGQSTTLCLVFQMPRSSRSMTTTKAITFLFMSLPDILPFLSLPDLIGQSVCGCCCLVLGYSGYAFGIFNLQNKNYLLRWSSQPEDRLWCLKNILYINKYPL